MSKKSQPEVILPDCLMVVPGIETGKQGKSTILSLLAEWYRVTQVAQPDLDLTMRLYDPDPLHRTLTRMFSPEAGSVSAFTPEERHRVVQLDIEQGNEGFTAFDQVLDNFVQAPICIIDSVAQKLQSGFGQWVRSLDFKQLEEDHSFKVLFVCPITSESATITQTLRTMHEWKDRANYLIVKRVNRDKKYPEQATAWDRDANLETREVAAQYNARVIDYPTFFDATLLSLNSVTGVEPEDLSQLAKSPMISLRGGARHPSLGSTARNRIGTEWRQIKETFDSVSDILLPPAYVAQLRK